MNKEEIPVLASKYRKNYRITTIIVSVFIFLIGAVVLTIGLILAFSKKDENTLFIVGIIMIIASVIDIILGIIFIENSFKNVKMLPDKVCAKRYLEVRGKR